MKKIDMSKENQEGKKKKNSFHKHFDLLTKIWYYTSSYIEIYQLLHRYLSALFYSQKGLN